MADPQKLEWVDMDGNSPLPEGAIIAGHAPDGTPLYLAHAFHIVNNPGYYDVRDNCARFHYQGGRCYTTFKLARLKTQD